MFRQAINTPFGTAANGPANMRESRRMASARQDKRPHLGQRRIEAVDLPLDTFDTFRHDLTLDTQVRGRLVRSQIGTYREQFMLDEQQETLVRLVTQLRD